MRFLIVFLFWVASIFGEVAHSENIRTELKLLYPQLSQKSLQLKIENAKTPFLFFRSFVPFYFKLTQSLSNDLDLLETLGSHTGWCVGDAHIENFGTLLDRNGNAFFSINDLDDGGPCPLVTDVLRFLTSVLLYDDSVDLAPIVDAYLKSLSQSNVEKKSFHKPTRELLEEAEKNGFELKKKDVNRDQIRLDRDEDAQEIDRGTKALLSLALKRSYGAGVQLMDSFEKVRESGGSGGLKRFIALVKNANKPGTFPKPIAVIEFKQISTPGIFPAATSPIPEADKRIQKSLVLEHGKDFSPLYQVQKLGQWWMLLRPRWAGHIGIKIEDYNDHQLRNIFEDEANCLGRLHRISANHLRSYLSMVLKTDPKQWIKTARRLAEKSEKAFNELNP